MQNKRLESLEETRLQRDYYSRTSSTYNDEHVKADDEHGFALAFLSGMLRHYSAESVLDIGSGTGRAIKYLRENCASLNLVGIEPVEELRAVAYEEGIPEDMLLPGDATNLPFTDNAFDFSCAFGVLHHIRSPELAIAEMLRVSRKGIFLSDANNFGQGSLFARIVKQIINAVGLWPLADLIKTRGKGFTLTEGDGLAYSYSLFNNYKQLRESCSAIHMVNTSDCGINFYRSGSHIAVLALKK